MADKGQQKPSVVLATQPLTAVEVKESKRVCGWINTTTSHVEEGSNYNFGVSSVGSGAWSSIYNSGPRNKTVYSSEFNCSPREFEEVVKSEKGESK